VAEALQDKFGLDSLEVPQQQTSLEVDGALKQEQTLNDAAAWASWWCLGPTAAKHFAHEP
jgi:hypothetical protein